MAQDTSFYSIVILIATILLIVILTYLAIEISKEQEEAEFPPDTSVCPDFWQQSGLNKCLIPLESRHPNNAGIFDDSGAIKFDSQNTPGYDTAPEDGYYIDMNNSGWGATDKGGSGNAKCHKAQWAKNYNIVWDGVTNFNKC